MGTALINSINPADDGTYSEGATASEWSNLDNLKDPLLSVKAQTNSDLDADFDIDLGENTSLSFVALLSHNLTSGGKWRVRLSQASDFSTTGYDSGEIKIWPSTNTFGALPWGEFAWGGRETSDDGDFGLLVFSAVSARYIRVDLTDSGNSAGFLEAGRFLTGDPWRPSRNIRFGWSLRYINPSESMRSRGSQKWTDNLPHFRRLDFTIGPVREAEAFSEVRQIDKDLGVAEDVFVVVDPDNTKHRHRQTIYGTLADTTDLRQMKAQDWFEKSYIIEESL